MHVILIEIQLWYVLMKHQVVTKNLTNSKDEQIPKINYSLVFAKLQSLKPTTAVSGLTGEFNSSVHKQV